MYVTPGQEAWLLANGLTPLCPEKGITLLEAAEYLIKRYNGKITWIHSGEDEELLGCVGVGKLVIATKIFTEPSNALSWGIDTFIAWVVMFNVQPNNNGNRNRN